MADRVSEMNTAELVALMHEVANELEARLVYGYIKRNNAFDMPDDDLGEKDDD